MPTKNRKWCMQDETIECRLVSQSTWSKQFLNRLYKIQLVDILFTFSYPHRLAFALHHSSLPFTIFNLFIFQMTNVIQCVRLLVINARWNFFFWVWSFHLESGAHLKYLHHLCDLIKANKSRSFHVCSFVRLPKQIRKKQKPYFVFNAPFCKFRCAFFFL